MWLWIIGYMFTLGTLEDSEGNTSMAIKICAVVVLLFTWPYFLGCDVLKWSKAKGKDND